MTFVLICTPAGERVHTKFFESCLEMQGHTLTQRAIPGLVAAHITAQGSILPDLRNKLAHKAVAENASHVLFLDTDMVFPPDSLIRLLKHDLDIVGVNYAMKRIPSMPTSESLDTTPNHTRKSTTGLGEVAYIATGVLLVKADVFRKLPMPWFLTPYSPTHGGYMTEDVYFCCLARETGFRIWCDHDLSKEVYHVGEREYHLSDVPGWDGA